MSEAPEPNAHSFSRNGNTLLDLGSSQIPDLWCKTDGVVKRKGDLSGPSDNQIKGCPTGRGGVVEARTIAPQIPNMLHRSTPSSAHAHNGINDSR